MQTETEKKTALKNPEEGNKPWTRKRRKCVDPGLKQRRTIPLIAKTKNIPASLFPYCIQLQNLNNYRKCHVFYLFFPFILSSFSDHPYFYFCLKDAVVTDDGKFFPRFVEDFAQYF